MNPTIKPSAPIPQNAAVPGCGGEEQHDDWPRRFQRRPDVPICGEHVVQNPDAQGRADAIPRYDERRVSEE